MKRSAHLRLSLMAIAVPVATAGCDSAPTATVMRSLADCADSREVTRAECELAYRNALSEHARVAPRFDRQADCDAQFGACTQATGDYGATFWVPPMAGFLVGYAATRRDDDAAGGSGGYLYRYRGSTPLYRDRRGDYYNPRGDRVARAPGPVRAKADAIHTPARAITVSRSGFGSSASARSSFGG